MNKLKERYYSGSPSVTLIDMGNILKKLKELYTIRLCIEWLNSTPIGPSVKSLINIANKSNKSNKSNESKESSDDKDLEVPHSSEKSLDYFKIHHTWTLWWFIWLKTLLTIICSNG